jgi:predicted short-subunit dehydrogenase-like oxidoreductase (DUF2520 family)
VKFIGAGKAQSIHRLQLSAADFILIATPDDKIPETVALLKQNFLAPSQNKIRQRLVSSPNKNCLMKPSPQSFKGAVVLHTSGALSSEVLQPLAEIGFAVGSCHPLQTFASAARAVAITHKAYFCLEGEAKALRSARRFVQAIGANHFAIRTEMKSLYHAAAVMSSGGVVALLSANLELLGRCGLSAGKARKVLLPLVEATVANIGAVGAAQALTGPIGRGDVRTVEKNLQAIAAVDGQTLELYRLLAANSLRLVENSYTDKTALKQIKKLLKTNRK